METESPDKTPEAMESTEDRFLSSTNGNAPDEGQEGAGPADALSEQELKGILEALLFVSHEPLPLDKVITVLAGPPKVAVQHAMQALQHDYDQEGRGLKIVELAGGYVMITRPDCAPWVTKLKTVKASAKVSRSALETLSIIAYKQPIMRMEIEQIRGVETSSVLRTLLEQKLIRIVGRKDVPGPPDSVWHVQDLPSKIRASRSSGSAAPSGIRRAGASRVVRRSRGLQWPSSGRSDRAGTRPGLS